MITGKTLIDRGWPAGPVIGAALRLAEALAADGHGDEAIVATLERVRAEPDAYARDDPGYALARAVQAMRPPKTTAVRHEPLDAPIWGEAIIDPQAIRQLHNAMRLPVTVAGALMPDAHVGYGIPIGGVVALDNAVAPYMVGVDIACFPGDTKIPTLAGTDRTLQELADTEDRFGVWACTPSGKVVAAWATATKTRKNAELLAITFDNGESVQCTPDHKFMLRDGSFLRADALRPDTSLMPFYSQLDPEGYLRIKQNYSGRWQRAHWIVARSGLLGEIPRFEGQRTVVHHKNFNESNNHPSNLQLMGDADHSAYHRSLTERNKHWQSQAFEKARKRALAEKAATPEGYKYFAERGRKNLRKYWDEDYERAKANCSGNGERGRAYLIARNKSSEGRAKSREIANRMYTCETCGKKVKSGIGLHNHRKWVHGYNHRVVAIEPVQESKDVYCLNVPGYENFAISAGVFVHNCRMMMSIYPRFSDTILQNESKTDKVRKVMREETRFGLGAKFGKYERRQHAVLDDPDWEATPLLKHLKDKAYAQLGTSGTGNHFVDAGILRVGDEGAKVLDLKPGSYFAIMTHSGSRGPGAQIANRYSRLAQERSPLPKELRHLAWLSLDTEAGQEYWISMNLAGRFASACHHTIHQAIAKRLGQKPVLQVENHHNFAFKETWQGKEVYVHRKGATPAHEGVLGIIPGSQGHNSYIVRGLGSEAALNSASHGAGRQMSRKQAKQTIPRKERDAWLRERGIELMAGGMDEAPQAYKDIGEVLALQTDLIEPVATFQPRLVLMADDGKSEG